ncbi:Phenylacetic acid degradation-related protein [Botryosphaeria dothidea]|uniref:Phenylacetic acid degradation-related protein n=1 Tax=Botryosphaeria dothidea TaxID=55169 RepID=A0A8H4N758_9PEZI|nr:Phenylacetic acid degradation-related protein [Botryosphaeria dothidea]
MATDEEIKAHVERCWAHIKPISAIYGFLLADIEITHASQGLVRARLPLTKNQVNSKGGIHGSVSATLVDWAGGLAISSYDLREKNGVSTDIHVTYVSSAREGDIIEVEGRANKVGGTLAFTSVVISKVVDGVAGPVIATGNHTKYVKM